MVKVNEYIEGRLYENIILQLPNRNYKVNNM